MPAFRETGDTQDSLNSFNSTAHKVDKPVDIDVLKLKDQADEMLREVDKTQQVLIQKDRTSSFVPKQSLSDKSESQKDFAFNGFFIVLATSAALFVIATLLPSINSKYAESSANKEDSSSTNTEPNSNSSDPIQDSISKEVETPSTNPDSSHTSQQAQMKSATLSPSSEGTNCSFKSYKLPSTDELQCTYKYRINSNGHRIVDVVWSDSYTTRYVFWNNDKVEIWDSDKKDALPEIANYEKVDNGVRISTNEGSVTILPGLDPPLNP